MSSSLLCFCIFDNLIHDYVVLYAAIYARKKSFLNLVINELVFGEEICKPFGKNEMVSLPNAS